MRTFVKKPKATQQISPANTMRLGKAQLGQSCEVSSILHLQRTIGNQAVQQLIQTKSKELETTSATTPLSRFEHDFTQIPVYSKANTKDIHLIIQNGTAGTARPLPHLDQIKRSFGPQHDLSRVKAYVGGQAAETTQQIGAEAYTSGERVAFRTTPNLHTAAHEAAHVVQQRSQIHISGGLGTKGDMYERHADAVANRVAAGHSSENLLVAYAGTTRNRPFSSPAIQCLRQNLPYVGPLASYLNLENQLARIFMEGLSQRQKTLLDGIFGNSLATSIIRLVPNSIIATGGVYRTIGNIIYMPDSTISDSTLIHEAAHVWQSQNTVFGVGYAVSALRAMAIAEILGGDWQRAYDYRKVERYRIPWRFWNAEQQASWIEDNRRLPSGWMIEGGLPNFGVESAGEL